MTHHRYTNAAEEIRAHARMFNWRCHTDNHRQEDTFIHGSNMVAVHYRRDGAVGRALRYLFFRTNNVQLQETAAARDKKSDVVGWLVRLGT